MDGNHIPCLLLVLQILDSVYTVCAHMTMGR